MVCRSTIHSWKDGARITSRWKLQWRTAVDCCSMSSVKIREPWPAWLRFRDFHWTSLCDSLHKNTNNTYLIDARWACTGKWPIPVSQLCLAEKLLPQTRHTCSTNHSQTFCCNYPHIAIAFVDFVMTLLKILTLFDLIGLIWFDGHLKYFTP